MKTKIASLIVLLVFFSGNLNAEPVNNKLPDLTDLIKTKVDYYEAEKICEDRGMRLPTAREMALLFQTRGAEISETEQDGFYPVDGRDVIGNPDFFYFSWKEYKRPEDKLEQHTFWTSSIRPELHTAAYTFNGYLGDVMDEPRARRVFTSVRCVRLHSNQK
ncbi:MAG: hypothetical protein CL678_08190 [Bdellovibrionaceae bacterium]|nr:hypothetical protein [Pseudobdellovibrionaceae bacterium]